MSLLNLESELIARDFGLVARRVFNRLGIRTVGELVQLTYRDLVLSGRCQPATLNKIVYVLADNGLAITGSIGSASKEIEVGCVVQLKSGGPRLTVEWIGQDDTSSSDLAALCAWFAGTELTSRLIPLSSLARMA